MKEERTKKNKKEEKNDLFCEIEKVMTMGIAGKRQNYLFARYALYETGCLKCVHRRHNESNKNDKQKETEQNEKEQNDCFVGNFPMNNKTKRTAKEHLFCSTSNAHTNESV